MIAVAALVLALWPVVGDAPWEDGVTEAELEEILPEEAEASSETKEGEIRANNDTEEKYILATKDFVGGMKKLLDNNCNELLDEIRRAFSVRDAEKEH